MFWQSIGMISFTLAMQPYKEKSKANWDAMNEYVILLFAYLLICLTDISDAGETRNSIGVLIIALVILSIMLNLGSILLGQIL